MRSRWLIVVAPIGLGLIVAALTALGWVANPVIFTRLPLDVLSVYIGVLLSLLFTAGLSIREASEKRYRQRLNLIQAQATNDRNRIFDDLRHELANPLTTLKLEVAKLESASLDCSYEECVAKIKAVVYHLGGLTEALEQLYRIETGLAARAPVDVVALLHEVVTVLQERAEATDRRLDAIQHHALPPPPVSGNGRLLYMAIYNLLDNALKYTRPGDKIEAEAVKEGAYAVIRVADTGPGIQDEDQPLVWNPFFRSKETRASVPGYGLGLALVRAIVARHAGQVSLESRVGEGTIITLRVPGMSEK